ncbi:hypothetical protein LV84_00015 [Algoriphagus ratkowskyi]|uniref:Uncharacterized protein n=1 Tax=Algoriphagus ratkowskyi TaxID=57028 RepID=A0A2W7S0T4_9BACT|nr:hypothetical protein [Algoriphagus ratkowskyi]PZX61027.1 hypothetical protein LV84_00015 [Algoriphagus ratkowskyi]TXD79165.1 hypothetical protein ESW18_02705 [Algoriphagus ratkowskyi]
MAKKKNNLDQFFKEKLENHTAKPSALAWERLESQLPQKSKSYKGIWWAAAASLTIVFTIGYLMLREGDVPVGKPLLSDNQTETIPENPAQTENSTHIETVKTQLEEENQQLAEELKTKPTITQPSAKPADTFLKTQKAQPKTPQNLVALNEQKEESDPVKVVTQQIPTIPIEMPLSTQVALPPLELEKAIAVDNKPLETEPTYTVKIYSSGLKEETKEKNLLAGIGKTVTEVEELLGKVDQGFADLQDAKNNLFASITTRKPKSED